MQIKDVPISEITLKAWNELFLPSFDLLYFEDMDSVKNLLGDDVLIYSREELQSDRQFGNLDIRTTFLTWRVKQAAQYVCIVPNDLLLNLDEELRDSIFLKQWELGRGQIHDLNRFTTLADNLGTEEKARVREILGVESFSTPRGDMVALQKALWDQLPWKLRVAFLSQFAEEYTDPSIWNSISLDIRREVAACNPYISSRFECFSSSNGPNCFAAAMAAAANSQHTTEWTIERWLQPKSLLLGLEVRNYKMAAVDGRLIRPEEIQMSDVLVWRNKDGHYVHATYSLGYGLVFNKDGQTMFNPWQVLKLTDVMKSWNDIIESGGEMIIYRKSGL